MNLYVYDQGQQVGPFPAESVQEMLRVGSISADAQVWHEGAPEWTPAATFFGTTAAAPAVTAPAHPAARAMARAAAASGSGADVPSEGTLFVRALAAGGGVAVLLGALWAGLQVITEMNLQLPLIIGSAIAYLCGWTVLKVSRECTGWTWISLAIGAAVLAWIVGIFGVIALGATPRIGLWTIVSFFFAMGTAWRVATE